MSSTQRHATIDLRDDRYALDADSRQDLSEEAFRLVEQTAHIDGMHRMIVVSGSHPVADLARSIERDVFDGEFGRQHPHTPEMMVAEYGPYEERSTFFIDLDPSSRSVTGVVRVIGGSPCKTLVDMVADGVLDEAVLAETQDRPMWDIGSIAVAAEHRGLASSFTASMSLYHNAYRCALHRGIPDWYAVIDESVLRFFGKVGVPFMPIAGAEDLVYLGSRAAACHLRIDDVAATAAAAARNDPESADLIGTLFRGAPPLADYRLGWVEDDAFRDGADQSERQLLSI